MQTFRNSNILYYGMYLLIKGGIKMRKVQLLELVEREKSYLLRQKVGSEEYDASLKRLMSLEKQVSDLEGAHKDWVSRTILESIKVGGSVILPLVGLVWITAAEKEITFTGALREYTKYFMPKKM